MNTWDTKWLGKLEQTGIRIKTGVRYMSDIRVFLKAIRAGWRWWGGTLIVIVIVKDGDKKMKLMEHQAQ